MREIQINNHGSTFVEALFQLACLCMIALTIPLLLPWYEKTKEMIIGTNAAEFEVFMMELRSDLQKSTAVRIVSKQEVEMTEPNPLDPTKVLVSSYLFTNKRIIKTYSYTGGTDIKLTNVHQVSFQLKDGQLTINCQMGSDSIRRRSFVLSPEK